MSSVDTYESGSEEWTEIRECRLRIDDQQCLHCESTEETAVRLEVHHVRPVSNGGSDRIENLRTLCERCHKQIHKLQPREGRYPLNLLEGVDLPERYITVDEREQPNVGVLHKRFEWMVPVHPAILEFLDSARDAYGNPALVTPQVIAWNTAYGRKHITRELQTLMDKGLVEKEDRGQYRLSERGDKLMSGEILPGDLEEES